MMSAGWLEEKYRYAFAILAEATKENQSVSSKLIGAEAVVALVKTTTLLLVRTSPILLSVLSRS